MTTQEILQSVAHRPWPLPTANWQYYQEWNRAIFLHWQVEYDLLKSFVPEELEIDVYEGKPWVSLVAFTMEKVRPRGLPAFKPVSDFHEINIRTYVTLNGKPGVYFLSIEGGKSLSCQIAKAVSQLPYRFSRMNRTEQCYHSRNAALGESFEVRYSIGNKVKIKSGVEVWLTERYALFQDADQSINAFEIHHVEWPLQHLELQDLQVHYSRFHQLLDQKPDKFHYSDGVQVLAWGMEKKDRNGTSK